MKRAEEIAAETYQIIGILAGVTKNEIDNRDVVRALDYFSAVANGEHAGEILPRSVYLNSE
jgi:hypothetical protein